MANSQKMQLPEYLREFSYEKTDYFRRTQIIYVSTITAITWGTSIYLTNFLDIICYEHSKKLLRKK